MRLYGFYRQLQFFGDLFVGKSIIPVKQEDLSSFVGEIINGFIHFLAQLDKFYFFLRGKTADGIKRSEIFQVFLFVYLLLFFVEDGVFGNGEEVVVKRVFFFYPLPCNPEFGEYFLDDFLNVCFIAKIPGSKRENP